jgi:hypothetical protein
MTERSLRTRQPSHAWSSPVGTSMRSNCSGRCDPSIGRQGIFHSWTVHAEIGMCLRHMGSTRLGLSRSQQCLGSTVSVRGCLPHSDGRWDTECNPPMTALPRRWSRCHHGTGAARWTLRCSIYPADRRRSQLAREPTAMCPGHMAGAPSHRRRSRACQENISSAPGCQFRTGSLQDMGCTCPPLSAA